MSAAIAWAVVAPLAGATAALIVGDRRSFGIVAASALATLGATAGVVAAVARHGPLGHPIGGWLAPLGIELRADGLAAAMLATIGVVGVLAGAHARGGVMGRTRPAGTAWPPWLVAWAALNALVLSGDAFNLYVTLELMTLAAVGLIALGEGRAATRAALRYLLFALPGSLVYLLGVALLYGVHGALDLATLGARPAAGAAASFALALMAAGLCLKGALFPFHAWPLPAYASAPPAVVAVLSGLIGKGAFYVLVRIWLEVVPADLAPRLGAAVGTLAAGGILWGSIQALRQRRLTMVIAYSSVAHTGYLFVWFPIGTPGALAGAVCVAISHAAAAASMFLAAGSIHRALGHDRMSGLVGLAQRLPITFFTLALAGVSLMGMPPSGGFIGKWLLVRAAIEAGQWWWAAVVLAGGLLAAGYVFRILRGAFLPIPHDERVRPVATAGELPALALAVLAVLLGLGPSPLLELLGAGGPG
ncbi:MAG TPA: proton-conducting transporter membrane subunit [Kofleriaceae bacterium]|nr:proton-conducting transporter membrane subunit [Kofleriaceae bacterium]